MKKEAKVLLLAYLMILVQKIVALGCFTALAIMFNKWWIVFFALLFWPLGGDKSVESEEECKKK